MLTQTQAFWRNLPIDKIISELMMSSVLSVRLVSGLRAFSLLLDYKVTITITKWKDEWCSGNPTPISIAVGDYGICLWTDKCTP